MHALKNESECSAPKQLERQDRHFVLHSAVASGTDTEVFGPGGTVR